MKCLFTYQAAVNDAWFDKDNYNGAIPTHAKAGLFEDREGFWKLQLFFFIYKQSIFDPCPQNCLSFSKKSPQKIV